MLAAVVGVGIGVGVHQLTARTAAAPSVVQTPYGLHGVVTWPAGAREAPMINTLPDQTGHVFSFASLARNS